MTAVTGVTNTTLSLYTLETREWSLWRTTRWLLWLNLRSKSVSMRLIKLFLEIRALLELKMEMFRELKRLWRGSPFLWGLMRLIFISNFICPGFWILLDVRMSWRMLWLLLGMMRKMLPLIGLGRIVGELIGEKMGILELLFRKEVEFVGVRLMLLIPLFDNI